MQSGLSLYVFDAVDDGCGYSFGSGTTTIKGTVPVVTGTVTAATMGMGMGMGDGGMQVQSQPQPQLQVRPQSQAQLQLRRCPPLHSRPNLHLHLH